MNERDDPRTVLQKLAERMSDDKVLCNLLKGIDDYLAISDASDDERSKSFRMPYSSDPEPIEPIWK